MPLSHLFIAILVMTIWGLNFIFIKIALDEFSPLLLCTLRFILSCFPAIFFIKPPKVSFFKVALYGLITFALQFSLIFIAMNVGMTAGMASLLMQMQIFFSMFFAIIFLHEEPHLLQLGGALIAFTGIGVVAMHLDPQHISLLGFLLILMAAAAWGLGNLITKTIRNVNMITLVVWGSFAAVPPMMGLTLFFEGFDSLSYTYQHLNWTGVFALLYIVFASTWLAYGLWNWLLSRHDVGTVVPFTLLIPVVGILGSVVFLGEPLQGWKLLSIVLVVGGLCINILSMRIYLRRRAQTIR